MDRSKDWISQAKRDLENANYEIDGGYYEWACFLAQQSAEKAVKAVLERIGAISFGHSVASLLKEINKKFDVPNVLIDYAKELDKAYIPTRYPNAHPRGAPYESYTLNEAKRLIGYAREIVRFCEDILSKI